LQAAFIENLDGSQLFDSMYAEDSDGQKFNKLLGVKEMLLSYPLLQDRSTETDTFLLRDADMHSTYLLRQRVSPTVSPSQPVLYQND